MGTRKTKDGDTGTTTAPVAKAEVRTALAIAPAVEMSNPAELIQLAITNKSDVESLEKLMALQERYQAYQAKRAYLAAVTHFQSIVPVIEKRKTVSFKSTSYKYAELGEITQTIKDALTACGISYRWELGSDGDKLVCTCIVSHVNGHSERTTMEANADDSGGKNGIQQRASAVTYMQRYTLIGALGLSTANEDNDGRTEETHQAPPQPSRQQTVAPEPQPHKAGKVEPNPDAQPHLSEKQYRAALERINQGDVELFPKLRKAYKMTVDQYNSLNEAHEFSLKVKRDEVKVKEKTEV